MQDPRIEHLETKVAEITALVDRLTREAQDAAQASSPGVVATNEGNPSTRRGILRMAGVAAVSAIGVTVGIEDGPVAAASNASDVDVADVGGFYAATDVEGVLAELPSRDRSFYNVRSFGAVGDGATDDTPAIQAAIDASDGFSGGAVYLPATAGFLYNVSTLHLPDRIWLVGEHRDVTIKKIAGSTGPVVTQNSASGGGLSSGFRNLTIDGNKAECPSGTDGIGQYPDSDRTGYRGDQCVIENLTVQNCRRHGINIGDVAANATYLVSISNVFVHHNDGDGLRLDRVYDGWVNGGWYASNLQTQIHLGGCANVMFDGKPQVEGFTSPPPAGTWRGVVLDSTAAGANRTITFVAPTITNCRGGMYLVGGWSDIKIVNPTFKANAQSSAANVDNLNVSLGAAFGSGLWIAGGNFQTLGGTDAVRYHINFQTSGGTLIGVFISDCLFNGDPGTDPLSGHCSVSPPGLLDHRYRGNVNLADASG